MPNDPTSDRAFKFFTVAYGKDLAPEPIFKEANETSLKREMVILLTEVPEARVDWRILHLVDDNIDKAPILQVQHPL